MKKCEKVRKSAENYETILPFSCCPLVFLRNFQSRLKISISLENFNPDLQKSPHKNRGAVGGAECTKIAHRHPLAIFTADEGITGNSAARTLFTHFLRRRNRGSLAFFFAEEIAHLGASKNRDFLGSGKNRRRNRKRIARFWCTQGWRA